MSLEQHLTELVTRVAGEFKNLVQRNPVHYAPTLVTGVNDTSALLSEMNSAKTAGKAFMARPDAVYTIDPIKIPDGLRIQGNLRVRGRTPGQSHVLYSEGTRECVGSSIVIDANSAIDGLVVYNADRSRYGYVEARAALRHGIHLAQTNGVTTTGNNDLTSWDHILVTNNGTKHTSSATVTSRSGIVNVINHDNASLTLTSELPAWAVNKVVGSETVVSAYFAMINGLLYRVKGIPNKTTLELYNFPFNAGTNVTVDVLLGSGMNIPMFHDNHAGHIGLIDAIGNRTIGLHHSAAYGWSITKSAYQGNVIGFGVWNFSQATFLGSPYWEGNTVDVAIGTNLDATFASPQWGDASTKLQSLYDRLSSRGQGVHPGIRIIGSTVGESGRVGPLMTPEAPVNNPGTLSLFPGYSYAFQKTAGDFNFRIAPSKSADLYMAKMIDLTLEMTGSWSGKVNFTLLAGGDYSPGTVMGQASAYSTPTLSSGVYNFKIFKLGTDWRVAWIKSA